MIRNIYKFSQLLLALIILAETGPHAVCKKDAPPVNIPKLSVYGFQYDTQYLLTFHPFFNADTASSKVKILCTPGYNSQIAISIPFLKQDGFYLEKKISANSLTELEISPYPGQCYSGSSEAMLSQVFPGRAIMLMTGFDITCLGMACTNNSSESYAALSSSRIGKQHVISSYGGPAADSNNKSTPFVSICAGYDNTRVKFYLGGNSSTYIECDSINNRIFPKDSIQKTLNAGDVWLIAGKGENCDLAGSYVMAAKPVAVFSGNSSPGSVSDKRKGIYAIEAETPCEFWGTKYYVTPVYFSRNNSVIRVFARQADTKIYIDGNKLIGTITGPCGTRDSAWMEFRPDSAGQPFVISGDKPINVVQYFLGEGVDAQKKPFSISLAPPESGNYQTTAIIPGIDSTRSFENNYVNLVYKSEKNVLMPQDLALGTAQPDGTFKWQDMASADVVAKGEIIDAGDSTGYIPHYLTLRLPGKGIYAIKAKKRSTTLTAYAYGFDGERSYGHVCSSVVYDYEKVDTLPPVPKYKIDAHGVVNRNDGIVIDMPDDEESRSNLSFIYYDKDLSFNYDFSYDEFVPGESRSTHWSLHPIDYSKDARAVITFNDRSGNDTTIVIDYTAPNFITVPERVDFWDMEKGGTDSIDVMIKNVTAGRKEPLSVIKLASEESKIETGYSKEVKWNTNEDFSVGETRGVRIFFKADTDGMAMDTLILATDSCEISVWKIPLAARVGKQVISVSDVDFGSVKVGSESSKIEVHIRNEGSAALKITGVKRPLNPAFKADIADISETSPLIIDHGSTEKFTVTFSPDKEGIFEDSIEFVSGAGSISDPVCILKGRGIKDVSVEEAAGTIKPARVVPNPIEGNAKVFFTIEKDAYVKLSLSDISGKTVISLGRHNAAAGENEAIIDLTGVPEGEYIITIEGGSRMIALPVIIMR